MGVNHPTFGTFCAVCFGMVTEATAAREMIDVHAGECARQAGIVEAPPTAAPTRGMLTPLTAILMIAATAMITAALAVDGWTNTEIVLLALTVSVAFVLIGVAFGLDLRPNRRHRR